MKKLFQFKTVVIIPLTTIVPLMLNVAVVPWRFDRLFS